MMQLAERKKSKMAITGSVGDQLAGEICNAFGLKHVQSLDIHLANNEIFTVTAKFYPEIDGFKQAIPIIKKFQLIPIEEESEKGTESK